MIAHAWQDGENIQDFHEQLTRAWGTVNVENQQDEYEVDAAALQATVNDSTGQEYSCWGVGHRLKRATAAV